MMITMAPEAACAGPTRRRATALALTSSLALLVFPACDGDIGRDGVTVRDSAGIAIVENSRAAWEEGEGWRLASEPMASIGRVEGPAEHRLTRVRGAVRLGTGAIVLADFGSNQVRWYDSTGGFLRAVGRKGGGPGEFDAILGLWRLPGDSVVVFDFGNARMTVLGPDGELGRIYRPEQHRALARPVGPFADGSFLVRSQWAGVETPKAEGVHRGRVLFLRWTPTGEIGDTLVERPGAVRYHGRLMDRDLQASPPFTDPTGFAVATADDRWYYGALDRFEIEVYTPGGDLRRLIRRDVPPRPVTAGHEEEWRRYVREEFSFMPAAVQGWYLNLPFPETLPAHGAILPDAEGNLWVAAYSLEEEPARWSVFDADGRFLGTVATPAGGTLTDVGADYVLGVWRDELDVERVRLYRLVKGE